jgi:DNA-binding beta-propeller fold protein YncE
MHRASPALLPSVLTGVMALALGLCLGCERELRIPAGLAWEEPSVASYIGQTRLAVTNNGDDTLSFVSADSLDSPRILGVARVGNIPIEPEGPHHLAASPDGQFIYFNLSNYVVVGVGGPHGSHGSGSVPGYLVKLDARTGRKLAEVLVDRSPGDVILSPDGKLAYVSHYDLARFQQQMLKGAPAEQGYSSIFIIDTTSMRLLSQTPLCPAAHGQGLSADGKTLYVTCALTDQLALMDVSDPQKPAIRAKVDIGPLPGRPGNPSHAPYALAVHPSGSVWISNNQSNDVRVFDAQRMQMDPGKVIPVGGIAMFGDFSEDGRKLYVPHQGDDRVTEIDTQTLATRSLTLPKDRCLAAHELRLLPVGGGAVVVCEGDHRAPGSLIFLDLAGWSVRGSVQVGVFPDAVIVLPPLS